MRIDFDAEQLPDDFYWLNEPHSFTLDNGLQLLTKAETDFWQRTHYGFRRDDGHCLLTTFSGDFTLETRVSFAPKTQYDQCGLIVRVDAENWIKCSVEYEDEALSRLGSVVTNHGYSDWATQDIASTVSTMCYRIGRKQNDFFIQYSFDGDVWQQMRIAHLHRATPELQIGVYACSPIGAHFSCKFDYVDIKSES
jgi:regulation of enolase protein 1 (concanavalin A-like superfamily)